jgi:peroxiredoxin
MFRAVNLQVVAVAMGQPKHNQQFCGKLAPSLTCLTHETSEPYAVYGLSQGKFGQLASLNVVANGAKAGMQGHIGGVVYGDVRMMPGTFLVDTEGVIVWVHYSRDVSDHPSNVTIVEAAKAHSRIKTQDG